MNTSIHCQYIFMSNVWFLRRIFVYCVTMNLLSMLPTSYFSNLSSIIYLICVPIKVTWVSLYRFKCEN